MRRRAASTARKKLDVSMSKDVFYSAPCLSDNLRALDRVELYGAFKGIDRRYLSQSLHKFLNYNQACLSFLDVTSSINGIDPDVDLSFVTGKYIGAIPLRSPANGKQIGDFLVYPRFSDGQSLFAQMTSILMMLNEHIEPEYMVSLPLASGGVVRPPHYYDAVKYCYAYQTAAKENWLKFRSDERVHPYPKSSTNWQRYVEKEHDPQNKLVFPSKDNILSDQHREWRQARFVFERAVHVLEQPTTPMSVRFPVKDMVKALSIKTQHIAPFAVEQFVIHASDPPSIKKLKEQGNIFLFRTSKETSAWRIDIAELFEKYVQHMVGSIVRELPVRFYANPRFSSRGYLPNWGLRYLEPDALIETPDLSIAVDAKYKAHFYSRYQTSLTLRETHREDLHQILAYCAFSSAKDKAGMLFYPADKYSSQSFYYTNQYNGTRNEIIIVGLPFEAEVKPETRQSLWRLLNSVLGQQAATT